MSLTVPVVQRFIVQLLSRDSQLAGIGVYDGIAPDGAAYPLISVNHISSVTKLVLGGRKLWNELLFQVEAYGRGTDITPLIPIAGRIDDVLHNASGTAIGGTVVDCVQDSEIKLQDRPVQGQIYSHLGARYRIHAQTS